MLNRLFQRNNQDQFDGLPGAEQAPYLVDMQAVVKEYNTPAGQFRALGGVDLKVNSSSVPLLRAHWPMIRRASSRMNQRAIWIPGRRKLFSACSRNWWIMARRS